MPWFYTINIAFGSIYRLQHQITIAPLKSIATCIAAASSTAEIGRFPYNSTIFCVVLKIVVQFKIRLNFGKTLPKFRRVCWSIITKTSCQAWVRLQIGSLPRLSSLQKDVAVGLCLLFTLPTTKTNASQFAVHVLAYGWVNIENAQLTNVYRQQ